jgi:predicted acyltransferase
MMTSSETLPVKSKAAVNGSQRLMSVDALRGFDMFWIIGAAGLVSALNEMSHTKVTTFLADQLEHVDWEGFHFYDLIFPLFVFIVGVSLVFSLSRTIEKEGRVSALGRVFRRGVLLYLIGIWYSGGLSDRWPDIRVMGVLNRIALAYFIAGLLFCCFKPRALAGICVGILAGYWALMSFTPIRDIQLTKPNLTALAGKAGDAKTAALFEAEGNPSAIKNSAAWAAAEKMFYATTNRVTGKFDQGLNLCDHLDFQYLPGRKYDVFYDPEGWLSTFPAVVTCLLGVFAGLLLKNQAISDQRKVLYLVGFGITAAAAGWVWGLQFPVIKKIWTSSYVLVAGGYSAILLGVFYQVVDVWKLRAWCQPFVWMGMNSITIYLASNILGGFRSIADRFVGGDIDYFLDHQVAKGFGDLVSAIVGLLLAFWLVHFLYKRKIFLRL